MVPLQSGQVSMTKIIDTIADDVYAILGKGVATPSDEQLLELGKAVALHVKRALEVQEPGPSVRPSNLGIKCDRKP